KSQGKRRVEQLMLGPHTATKIAARIHFFNQVRRNHLSRFVGRKASESFPVPHPVLQHLRGCLNEIPLSANASKRQPALIASKQTVQQMTKLVQKGFHVRVKH